MNLKKIKGGGYVAPEMEIIDLHLESVLCSSPGTPWYKQGGEGDFDYTVTEEITWQ